MDEEDAQYIIHVLQEEKTIPEEYKHKIIAVINQTTWIFTKTRIGRLIQLLLKLFF